MYKVGDSYTLVTVATEDIIKKIAEVSLDVNPLHMDEEYAKKTRFGKRIAHGLFCLNAISAIIGVYLPGPGSIIMSENFNYVKPVYVDDEISTTLTITKVREDKGIYTCFCECKNQDGTVVLDGECVVMFK